MVGYDMNRVSIYDHSPVITGWLSETFCVVESASFFHWVGLHNLTGIVDRCEAGEVPMFVAIAAIQQYNKRKNTVLTYSEVKDRCCTYVFSDVGGWVAFTDPAGVSSLLSSGTDNTHEAFLAVDPRCRWLILWEVKEDIIAVYRSPYVDYRASIEGDVAGTFAHGAIPGDHVTYVLPPEIIGSIQQEISQEQRQYARSL